MKKKTWVNRIKKACIEAGTYEPYFDEVIRILAEILEKRDAVQEAYKEQGSQPLISYTNKGGATNMIKNPILKVWDDLNKSALAYWRDLGLTPSGLKKITGNAPEKEKKSALAQALTSLED